MADHLARGTTIALISAFLLVQRAAPRLWCYLGLLDALVGFISLEGTKSLRIANSLIGVVWMLWLAVMFFRGQLVRSYQGQTTEVSS